MKTKVIKLLIIMAVAVFAIENLQAHGSGWVIVETAKSLGIEKDPTELTPSEIDRLTDKQANGLAKIERQMWGFEGAFLHGIKAKNNREWIKKANVRIRAL